MTPIPPDWATAIASRASEAPGLMLSSPVHDAALLRVALFCLLLLATPLAAPRSGLVVLR